MPVISSTPDWRAVQAADDRAREARLVELRAARERGEVREARPVTMEPFREFGPRHDKRVPTLEDFNRMENQRIRPYAWMS